MKKAFPRWRHHSPEETKGRAEDLTRRLRRRHRRTHLWSVSRRPGAEAPEMDRQSWRPTGEAPEGASAVEKRKHAARAGSHHSGGTHRRPLLIAGAATRVTRSASPRLRSPAPGMAQPTPVQRAQSGEPFGRAHWPDPRLWPRPRRGACPRGEGRPPLQPRPGVREVSRRSG